jgi:capsular exopolysaccharide synthesis family protein
MSRYPTERTNQTSFRDIWAGLQRNRMLIALCTLVVVGITVAIILLSRPQFESEASLRFVTQETESALLSRLPEGLADIAGPSIQGDDIDTEIGVLRSRRVAEAVVDSFSLHVSVSRPAIARDSVLRVVAAPRDVPAGRFTLDRRGDGSYDISAKRTKTRVALPDRVEIGAPFRLGSAELLLAPLGREPDRVVIDITPFNEAVEGFREDLRIEKQEGRSRLVEIQYRDPDRTLAAGVVNAVVHNFMTYRTSADHSDLRHRVEALREQVGSHQAELRQAEESLRAYREEFRILEPEEEAIQHVRMLAEIRAEREKAVIEREALGRVFAEMERAPTTPADGSRYRELAAFPSFITNEGVQQILQSLMVLEESRSQLLLRRTPENVEVERVERRIAELEGQLRRLASDYLSSLGTQISAADASLARFGAELQTVPQREMEYARLVRDTRLLNQVYLGLQARLRDSEIQYASAPPEVRVVDTAIVADEPAWPKPAVMLILGTMLGLMVGVVTAVAREAMDDKVRSQWQAEIAAGGVPVVGLIPHMDHLAEDMGWRRRLAWRWRNTPVIGTRAAIPGEQRQNALVTRDEPDHQAAEAFRALRTTLVTNGAGVAQVLAVASPLPGDGKSTSAANLAVTLTQQGLRVLLIDGDLRRGTLHRLLGAQQAPGLSDVLRGTHRPDAVLQELELDGGVAPALHLIAAGSAARSPAELLGSEAMRGLLAEVRGQYDRIVIDSPALQSAADGMVIAGLADSVLLVLRAGTTDRGVAQQAATRLRRMHVPVGGIILNDLSSTDGAGYDSLAYGGAFDD